MKKNFTTIFLKEGAFTDFVAISKIDATHIYLKRIKSYRNGKLVIDYLGSHMLDEEFVKTGAAYHVAQFNYKEMQQTYNAILRWMSGEEDIEGKEYLVA